MKRRYFSFLIIIFTLSGAPYCSKHNEKPEKIIVFHAGSLSVPFAAMKKKFEAEHPGLELQLEASGSLQAARKISDLKKPCDIIASADYRVIDNLLVPHHADWNILFANNQLVLCYTRGSRYAGEINRNNWYTVLQKKDVVWGHSDPSLDPCGYRALMVLQLAEKHYKIPGLYAALLANRHAENIRPKSVELISMIETGNMDYAWEYLSVAVQHKLKYIAMPDEINLGNSRYDHNYRNAVVRIRGEKPGMMIDMRGETCAYGVALLRNAPNRKGAEQFLEYMLDTDGGLGVFKEMGQPPVIPCRIADERMREKVPVALQNFITAGN